MYNLKQNIMQKKNLFVGALLVCLLTMFTGCKEIMGSLDNPVSSYLKMSSTSVTIAYGGATSIKATTISDAPVTYTSSDESVATVDANGLVTAKACGDAVITASVKATEYYQAGSATCKVAVRINNAEEFAAALEAGATKFVIADDSTINFTDEIVFPAEDIVITSNADAPATITMKKNFNIKQNFTISNLKIDGSNLTQPFIKLSADGCDRKNQDVYTDAQNKDVNLLGEININNVMIKEIKKDFITNNSTDWALETLNIENSIIQLNNSSSWFIRFNNGGSNGCIKNINIKNNTIYNLAENSSRYFIAFKNASNSMKVFGTTSTSKLDWNISNNTIIRTMTGSRFGTNMTNNKAVTNTVCDNIFYDVYRVYQYLQNNQTRTTTGNYAYYDVTNASACTNDQSRKDSNGNPYTTKLESAPFTVPTAALDLTKKNGGLSLTPSGEAAKAGDPRWIK